MAAPTWDIELWRQKSLQVKRDCNGKRATPNKHFHATTSIMNLALIDPFQLAQDSPDTLTNDLSTYPKKKKALTLKLLSPVSPN